MKARGNNPFGKLISSRKLKRLIAQNKGAANEMRVPTGSLQLKADSVALVSNLLEHRK